MFSHPSKSYLIFEGRLTKADNTDDFSKAQGLNELWYKDTAITAAKAGNNGFAARHAYLIQSEFR